MFDAMIQDKSGHFLSLEDWVKEKALPLWLGAGIDPKTGANYEMLSSKGEPLVNSNLRVRVQARQIFVYAFAHYYGWCNQSELVARDIQAFVDRYCKNNDGAGAPVAPYFQLLDSHFNALDKSVDLYDCAFFLLANAWCYRSFGDKAALNRANNIFAFIENNLSSPKGGWLEGNYPHQVRRQNPHMHLFEAFMALFEATREARWLNQAGEMFKLFKRYFYCEQTQVVREYFTEDWQVLEGEKGREVEPGHLFEWVWLLRKYSQLSGTPVGEYANALYQKALSIGMDEAGLVYDVVDAHGGLIKSTKRCWPLTEKIKAHVAQALAGDEQAFELAKMSIDCLFKYYLDVSTIGAYVDQLGEDNQIINDTIQASTMYHLVVAAREVSLLDSIC